ncbi:MAG: dihydrofolate reductase [Verrucomicrobiota bacterium]
MKLVIIAALAQNGTIGDAGKIPWHISEDLKRFKRLTLGHPIIMGRKTYESLGKPLPGRRNIILSRQPGRDRFPSLEAALKSCGDETIFIIGGAEIYRLALPLADTLLLTHVHRQVAGDTQFPDYDRTQWREVSREDTADYSFVEYEKSLEHPRS